VSQQAVPEKLSDIELDVPLLSSSTFDAQPAGVPAAPAAALVSQRMTRGTDTVSSGSRSRAELPSVQQLVRGHLQGDQPQEGWPAFTPLKTAGSAAHSVAVVLPHARRPMSGERVRQLLKHMSTALLTYAFALDENPIEVQCMRVQDRVIIAGNNAGAMIALYERLRAQGLPAVAKMALASVGAPPVATQTAPNGPAEKAMTQETTAEERVEQARHVQKFADVARTGKLRKPARAAMAAEADTPERQDAASAAALAELIKAAENRGLIDLVTSEKKAADLLMNKASAGHVIVLAGGSFPHAEQNLMKILLSLKEKPHATIQGVKRSCTACYLCLQLLTKKKGYSIDFSNEPGAAFTDGFKQIDVFFQSHLREMEVKGAGSEPLDRAVLDLLKELLPKERHETQMTKHTSRTLDTLSDSETEL